MDPREFLISLLGNGLGVLLMVVAIVVGLKLLIRAVTRAGK